MDTNEPGREPTEPTDAAMFPREAQINTGWTLDYGFICRVSDRTRGLEYPVGMEETESVLLAAEVELSGQRPMPGSEVSRAEVLRMSTDTLLNAEAERLPDTPAPDEVKQPPEHFCTYPDCRCHPDKLEGWCAKGLPTPISLWRQNAQLRAEVARAAFDLQCAATDAHALTARVAEFEHDAALLRALAKTWEDFSAKFQQDAKVAEARVAELGAELAALREGNKPPVYEHHPGWVCTKEAQAYFDKEAAPGKEPTSE